MHHQQKVCPKIDYAVSETNKSPLKKVEGIGILSTTAQIGLYSDVAVFIKDRGSQPTYKLARIHRMLKPGNNRGKVEYKMPIELDNDQHQTEC